MHLLNFTFVFDSMFYLNDRTCIIINTIKSNSAYFPDEDGSQSIYIDLKNTKRHFVNTKDMQIPVKMCKQEMDILSYTWQFIVSIT